MPEIPIPMSMNMHNAKAANTPKQDAKNVGKKDFIYKYCLIYSRNMF